MEVDFKEERGCFGVAYKVSLTNIVHVETYCRGTTSGSVADCSRQTDSISFEDKNKTLMEALYLRLCALKDKGCTCRADSLNGSKTGIVFFDTSGMPVISITGRSEMMQVIINKTIIHEAKKTTRTTEARLSP